jgi:hypothetical protein
MTTDRKSSVKKQAIAAPRQDYAKYQQLIAIPVRLAQFSRWAIAASCGASAHSMPDVDGNAQLGTDATVEIKERLPTLAPPVFIHAAPRTSSTWLRLQFGERDPALCYYEPFNDAPNWIAPQRADSRAKGWRLS